MRSFAIRAARRLLSSIVVSDRDIRFLRNRKSRSVIIFHAHTYIHVQLILDIAPTYSIYDSWILYVYRWANTFARASALFIQYNTSQRERVNSGPIWPLSKAPHIGDPDAHFVDTASDLYIDEDCCRRTAFQKSEIRHASLYLYTTL